MFAERYFRWIYILTQLVALTMLRIVASELLFFCKHELICLLYTIGVVLAVRHSEDYGHIHLNPLFRQDSR